MIFPYLLEHIICTVTQQLIFLGAIWLNNFLILINGCLQPSHLGDYIGKQDP